VEKYQVRVQPAINRHNLGKNKAKGEGANQLHSITTCRQAIACDFHAMKENDLN